MARAMLPTLRFKGPQEHSLSRVVRLINSVGRPTFGLILFEGCAKTGSAGVAGQVCRAGGIRDGVPVRVYRVSSLKRSCQTMAHLFPE